MFLLHLRFYSISVFVPKRKRDTKANNDEPDSKRGKIVSVGGPAAIFKAQPLTIEELKKNASALTQQDQGGKPVFMTAAARKKLAEEHERAVEEEEQQKEKEIKESRETFFKQGEFLILIVLRKALTPS